MSADPGAGARAGAWRGWVGWTIVVAAFIAGVATDTLGGEHRVNLLALPLLGVIGWNLAVYLMLGLRVLARISRRTPQPPGPLAQLTARLAGALRRAGSDPHTPAALATRLPAAAQGLSAADLARSTQVLHAASAALAVGLLASLYLRGLAFEYLAGWQSTFLGPQGVHRLLGLILGPASTLTGLTLPGADHLATLRFSTGSGENAGPWIHLYAVTLGLYVLLPRAVLAALAGRKTQRLERETAAAGDPRGAPGSARSNPPSDDAAFSPPASAAFSQLRVRVLPYSFQLPPGVEHGLRALLERELGLGVRIEMMASLSPEQAERPQTSAVPGDDEAALVIVLFSMAATPEPQTHGEFIHAVRRGLPPGAALRALVDETAFSARFAGNARRLDQRRRTWRNVLGKAGAPPRFAHLAAHAPGPSPAPPDDSAAR